MFSPSTARLSPALLHLSSLSAHPQLWRSFVLQFVRGFVRPLPVRSSFGTNLVSRYARSFFSSFLCSFVLCRFVHRSSFAGSSFADLLLTCQTHQLRGFVPHSSVVRTKSGALFVICSSFTRLFGNFSFF